MIQKITPKNNDLMVKISDFDPFQTFMCGQCFRWYQDLGGIWTGIVMGRCLKLHWDGEYFTFFNMEEKEFLEKWVPYFDLNTDYAAIKAKLSKMDEHLEKAVAFGSGIRLLRQDLWETLLSFLISQNNGVPRIKQIVEALSLHFGKPIPGHCDRHAFPEANDLAAASLEELNSCRGGYRCRYILSTAKKLQESPNLLNQIRSLSKEEARALCLSFTGIGEKVADCILLYSGTDRSAFPIDRWIKRVMEALYFKKETDQKAIRAFSREYFGNLAGIAQQYLFYYAREHKISLY